MIRYRFHVVVSLLGAGVLGQNVGIGTSTPTAKLHVYNPAGTAASLVGYFQNLNNAAGNNGVLIEIARDQSDAYGLDVRSGGTSRLYVRADKRVGINTTSPLGTLHVVQERGVGDVPRGIVVDNFFPDPWAPQVNQRKARGSISSPAAVQAGDVLAGWHAWGHDGSDFGWGATLRMFAAENWTPTAHGTYITLENIPQGSVGMVERVRVNHNGYVGIGTTTPEERLHVSGSIVWGTGTIPYPTTPAGAAMIGKGGTSNYRVALQDGSGRINHYWNAYRDATDHKYVVSGERATRFLMGWDGGNGAFRFQVAPPGTAGSSITWEEALFISDNAYVGIGTASPNQRLEVNGNVKADAFIANKYPRVVGYLDVNGPDVTINSVGGWRAVPSTSSTSNMEVNVTVDGPADVYLVVYAYRVQGSVGSYKWSRIHILQGATSVKFISADGSNGSFPDYGASGAVFVTGLAAGAYTFRLEDWSGNAENRTFTFQRQLLVYRLR